MTPRTLHAIYRMLESLPLYDAYRARHGIAAANVLSVLDVDGADRIMERLAPEISGKVVVEIGAGTGLLGIAMGGVAERVFCVEANPLWSTTFALDLMRSKPKNVSFLFGAASEFEGIVRGDVALFCAHIGVASLSRIASRFAPRVLDVYGELFGRDAVACERQLQALRAAGIP